MKNTLAVAILGVATLAFVGGGCKKKVAAAPPAPPAAVQPAPAPQPPPQQAAPAPARSGAAGPGTAAATQGSGCRNPRAHRDAARQDRGRLFRLRQAHPASRCHQGAASRLHRTPRHRGPVLRLPGDHRRPRRRARFGSLQPGTGRCPRQGRQGLSLQHWNPRRQLAIISYGKDRPVCEEHDETCWQKNRRIHFVSHEVDRRVPPEGGTWRSALRCVTPLFSASRCGEWHIRVPPPPACSARRTLQPEFPPDKSAHHHKRFLRSCRYLVHVCLFGTRRSRSTGHRLRRSRIAFAIRWHACGSCKPRRRCRPFRLRCGGSDRSAGSWRVTAWRASSC